MYHYLLALTYQLEDMFIIIIIIIESFSLQR